MSTHPQPKTPPTSLENVRLVVIGGEKAGIYTVTKGQPMAPATEYAGPCFPFSIYCRSPAEAETVWQLQGLAEIMEKKPKEKVAAAFITSVVLCHLFKEDETADFHAAFLGFYRRPVVFFTWADAYPYAQCFPNSKVQRAKMFVDAIVYLCLGPRSMGPEHAIEFVRPPLPEFIALVGSQPQIGPTQAASRAIQAPPSMASTSTSTRPVVVVSDSSDDEASAVVPTSCQIASMGTSDSRQAISGLPAWVSSIHWNADVSHDTVFYRTRNVKGELVRTYTSAPMKIVLVPSLGATADILVDGVGFIPDAIRCLHTTFIDARQQSTSRVGWFLNTMAGHGMPLIEAAMFWGLIRVPTGTTFQYREKYVFDE